MSNFKKNTINNFYMICLNTWNLLNNFISVKHTYTIENKVLNFYILNTKASVLNLFKNFSSIFTIHFIEFQLKWKQWSFCSLLLLLMYMCLCLKLYISSIIEKSNNSNYFFVINNVDVLFYWYFYSLMEKFSLGFPPVTYYVVLF